MNEALESLNINECEPMVKIEKITGEEGFDVFKNFMRNLRNNYPQKYYPKNEVLDEINPKQKNDSSNNLLTYISYLNNNPAGVLIGDDRKELLFGYWFAVDPKYQNTDVAKKLISSIQSDFDKVKIIAFTFGGEKTKNPTNDEEFEKYLKTKKDKVDRQNALIRYYTKLGFVPDSSSESYKYSNTPGSPMPMIWKKEN
jgi:GNAT superfamily N-acetyltransferase